MKNCFYLIFLVVVIACNPHPEVKTVSVARETSTIVLDDKIILYSLDPTFRIEEQSFIYDLSNDSSRLSLKYQILEDTFSLNLSQSSLRFKTSDYKLEGLEIVEGFFLPFIDKKPIKIDGAEMPFERLYLFATCNAINRADTIDCIISQSIRFEIYNTLE